MLKVQNSIAILVKPSLGPLYQHFTEQEVLWLVAVYGNTNDVARCTFKKEALELQNKFPNLAIFEPLIREFYTSPSRLLICLANYGRIRLPLEFSLRGLSAAKKIWPDDQEALVNKGLINKIWDYSVNVIGRSSLQSASGDQIINTLAKWLLWIGKPIHKAIDDFEYLEDSVFEICKGKGAGPLASARSQLRTLRMVLAHMGYQIDVISKPAGDLTIWGKNANPTVNSPINEAMELWGEHIKNSHPYKTIQTKFSHARFFINWLTDEFPEIISLRELERDHIRAYLCYLDEYRKGNGEELANATKNHRVELLNQWLAWLRKHQTSLVSSKLLITKLDLIAEAREWPERISRNESKRLFQVLCGMDEIKWFAIKMTLIIMTLTGLRINSVITLHYDCVAERPMGNFLRVHKTKGNNIEGEVQLNDTALSCIHKLQNAFKGYSAPIYSPYDQQTVRRLIIGSQGATILAAKTIREVFNQVQLQSGLIDDKGEPRFTPHDLRRVFVSALLAQGATPEDIAEMLIQKNVSSLLPYEVFNQKAIEVFKKIEKAKTLEGANNGIDIKIKSIKESTIDDITELLLDVDVVQRQLTNLMHKNNNPEESFPLVYGTCVCSAEIDCDGDDLTCLGCDNFNININKLYQIDDYLKKVFRQKWVRDKKDIVMPRFEERLKRIEQRVYIQQIGMTTQEVVIHLEKLRSAVTPKRGRPSKGGA